MKTEIFRKMKTILFLLLAYLTGIVIGICFLALRLTGTWRINGIQNFPRLKQKGDRGFLVVSNHPSLLEPIGLVGLFSHWYIFHPKLAPWNIADIAIYGKGIFRLLESRLILIDRKSTFSESRAFVRARRLLKSGSVLFIFPEGGRTYKGIEGEFLHGINGEKMRPFKNGVGFLATQTHALVLPVWVKGTDKVAPNGKVAKYPFLRFWKRVDITIGRPVSYTHDVLAETATRELERMVIDLSG